MSLRCDILQTSSNLPASPKKQETLAKTALPPLILFCVRHPRGQMRQQIPFESEVFPERMPKRMTTPRDNPIPASQRHDFNDVSPHYFFNFNLLSRKIDEG